MKTKLILYSWTTFTFDNRKICTETIKTKVFASYRMVLQTDNAVTYITV